MNLLFQKCMRPGNKMSTIKRVKVKSEAEAIRKIVSGGDFPEGTTAIALQNFKTGKTGYFYKDSNGSEKISYWSGYAQATYKNAFLNKKGW